MTQKRATQQDGGQHSKGHGHTHGHFQSPVSFDNYKGVFSKSAYAKLSELNSKYFPEYSKTRDDDFAYRRAFYNYLTEAHAYLKDSEGMKNCIELAINFHNDFFYKEIMGRHTDCTRGQKPGIFLFSNCSEDKSEEIFGAGARATHGGVQEGGSFGSVINVRDAAQLGKTRDFEALAYMMGHMIEHGDQVPYATYFVGAYGTRQELERMEENKVMELAVARRDKCVADAMDAGHFVDFEVHGKTRQVMGTPVMEEVCKDGKITRMHMVALLHSLKEARYYVLERQKDFSIAKIPVEEWVKGRMANGVALAEYGCAPQHLSDLERHKGEADFFDEYTLMQRARKGIYCVDSRHYRINSSTIKELGAVMPKEERERILKKKDIQQVTVCYHMGCGYLTTAMALHLAGMELKRIFEEGIANGKAELVEETRRLVKQGFQAVAADSWKGFAWPLLKRKLEMISNSQHPLSDGSYSILHNLLAGKTGDIRDITHYMRECGVMIWNNTQGTIVAPAAFYLEKALPKGHALKLKNWTSLDPKGEEYKRARRDWERWVTCHALLADCRRWEKSAKEMGRDDLKLIFHIEDFATRQMIDTDGKRMWDSVTKEEISRL